MERKRGNEIRLSKREAFAISLPVLVFLVPLVVALLAPRNEFTRFIFGGWGGVLFIALLFGGSVWWSNRLLKNRKSR